MSQLLVHSTLALGLVLFTTGSARLRAPELPDNYNEECLHEGGCSAEELSELDEDYNEECLSETCSTGELSNIAGGGAFIDQMLIKFIGNGWLVSTTNFQSQPAPGVGQVWWYTGGNYTGMIAQTTANTTSMPNIGGTNFNTSILGLKIGSGITSVTLWTKPSYAGTSLVTPASIANLSATAPTFANNVQSAQITPSP